MRGRVARPGYVQPVEADLPPELAEQLDPSIVPTPRQGSGTRTNYNDPPYSDEWREEKSFVQSGAMLASTTLLNVLRLQRAWPLVGFGVFPGNLPAGAGNEIDAFLFALVKGRRVAIATQTIGVGTIVEAVGQAVQMGAPAELAIFVKLALPGTTISGIVCSLWGSPFR